MSERPPASGPRWQAQCGIAGALLLLAAVLWRDMYNLPASAAIGVGPGVALKLVSGIVGLLGVAHLVTAWRAWRRGPSGPTDRGNKASLAAVIAGLLGMILALEFGAGFVPSAAWLFVLTAIGFGEKLCLRLVAIGAALPLLVYLFFTKALSLALPAGPLERLLG